MDLSPIVLEGQSIRLEPLTLAHHGPFCEAGLDAELWRLSTARMETGNDMRVYIETALAWQQQGTSLPFATVERATGRVIGSTRFANADHANRRVEIGWTWIARPWQRTAANTEAKYLMLRHAFETLGCIRVEFKTDSLNARSRAALLRIGATEEGTLRNHMIVHDGRKRHSVYFSVIDEEWPVVKAELESKLAY
jgi:RimJ/RimL family protein N-acetyltransferase